MFSYICCGDKENVDAKQTKEIVNPWYIVSADLRFGNHACQRAGK
ncbi:MAG: hypothetical protein WCA21_12765 [Terracidiphilus sp.]|jgi:hypothetical protein